MTSGCIGQAYSSGRAGEVALDRGADGAGATAYGDSSAPGLAGDAAGTTSLSAAHAQSPIESTTNDGHRRLAMAMGLGPAHDTAARGPDAR